MSSSSTSEFKSSVGAVLIRVPAGSFIMGSSESEDGHRIWERQREVTFCNDFYLGKTPVTQGQYRAVIGTNPTDHEQIDDAPVDSVNWNQANEFCLKLTKNDREAGVLPGDWEYRLPTEAEWEYVCRAGESNLRYRQLDDVAWYHDNSDERPHPVCQKSPNVWGFYDMLGNVWEWCQDSFCMANPRRSARGGSYFNSASVCRSAQRWGWNPNSRGRYCGLRLLAAPISSFELSPPIDDFPTREQPPTIYDAIDAKDFDLARRVILADPAAIESVDEIPPPLHDCIFHDNPEMLEWLLDNGANIERRDQDYGSPPLLTAVISRQKRIIPILVSRGAKTNGMLKCAQNGLAGAYENSGFNRAGYREIVDLLQSLGIEK